MKRLLCITSTLNAGGAETFLMKLHKGIDRDKYQIDFCVMSDEKGVYDEEVLARGGKIFRTHQKSKNPVKCFLDIKRIVKENEYKYVLRVNEHSLSVIDLIAAKCGGAKVIAMRSTIADCLNKFHKFLHKLFIFLPKTVPNVKLAPSTEAAEYVFGKGCVKKGKAKLLHNALDFDGYKFDSEARAKLRNELSLEGCNVIGHVGRFSYQKNHSFLFDVFKCISKVDDSARLVLVGVGELQDAMRKKARELSISDKVIFLGRRNDVPKLMSAFDVLMLPSFCEGMPNVVIEAQASGLPCVIADTITSEADITGLVKYLSLNDDVSVWKDAALGSISENRKDTLPDFTREGYHLNQVVERFAQLIFEGATN